MKNHPLLANLNNKQTQDLQSISRIKELRKNEGLKLNKAEIYLLIEGKVKNSQIDRDGNEIIKEVISEGGIFGEIALHPSPHTEFVEALTYRVLICVIRTRDFEGFLERNPSLAVNFSKTVWAKLRQTEDKYTSLVLKDAKTRLLHFFQDWALREGERDGNRVLLKNYLTHEEIASLICATRVTVTSILNKLKAAGYIRYSKKMIEIPDINALA